MQMVFTERRRGKALRPSLNASLQVLGDEEFARELRFTGRRATHAKPLYEELGWFLSYRVVGEQFRTHGARSGEAWAPLAPSTIKKKGHSDILRDGGDLEESFKLWDPENVYEATDDYLRYGSKVDYGHFHQTGTEELRGQKHVQIQLFSTGGEGVPQRKILDLTTHDREHIVKQMQEWVIKGSLS
jgi:phage gpG-like protein